MVNVKRRCKTQLRTANQELTGLVDVSLSAIFINHYSSHAYARKSIDPVHRFVSLCATALSPSESFQLNTEFANEIILVMFYFVSLVFQGLQYVILSQHCLQYLSIAV